MHMLSLALTGRVFLIKDHPCTPLPPPAPVILRALIGGHWSTVCFSSDLIIFQAPLIDFLTLRKPVVSSGPRILQPGLAHQAPHPSASAVTNNPEISVVYSNKDSCLAFAGQPPPCFVASSLQADSVGMCWPLSEGRQCNSGPCDAVRASAGKGRARGLSTHIPLAKASHMAKSNVPG